MKRTLCALIPAALCLLAVTLLNASPAAAQQTTLGTLNGTVADVSGASIPGAKVTATSEQTGFTRSTTTESNGYWELLNLPIGAYTITVSAQNFETQKFPGLRVQELRATTVNALLKPGQVSQSVIVSANPLLNATDTTNGYTLDRSQIDTIPLATGSFTQLSVLSPGVNAEFLSGLDTNAGLGNQNVWANGQRATSNTWQLNGVDTSNIFNGMSSSGLTSQRYNFNIGGGSTSSTSSAGSAYIGGAAQTGTSVYGSTGNSLPAPPTEMLSEMRVNTSMYDAQQGMTSGAQIDASTATGTNSFHGQIYGLMANNLFNASPFFFRQEYLLAQEGVGAFPGSLANPALHRWTLGGTMGGPVIKNKLFFFAGYQHLYLSDESTAVSQLTVPSGLTDDRSPTGIAAAATSWNNGKAFTAAINPIALAIMQAKVPTGGYLIPSAQTNAPYQYGVPNVTLIGTSTQIGEQGTGSLQYNLSAGDQLSLKYYYQTAPIDKLYGLSSTGGFPQDQKNGSQVGAISNTQFFGSKLTATETLGYARMYSYSRYTQTVPGGNFGIGPNVNGLYMTPGLPGLLIKEMGTNSSVAPGVKVGPFSSFANIGFYQNRLNPSANIALSVGRHTIQTGGGFSYTQLNIENNRDGIAQVTSKSFQSFLQGQVQSSSVLETQANGRNNADRYYRVNEGNAYAQDKWQILSNLSISGGIRWDYHGGMTEKYGNMFNFDPARYGVTGTTTSGFVVNDSGFVIAGNNKFHPTSGVSDSTLTGRQWGISPRVGFAWAPKRNHGNLVWRGGFGLYFDRGELFSYLSQPAGSGNGGPFGVTESAPLASYVVGGGKTLADPIGTPSAYVPPSADPGVITQALQATLNGMTGSPAATSSYAPYGPNCGGVQSQEGYFLCPDTLNFGAYDNKNVLPYSMNFTLNAQWQPTTNIAITVGYTGNRGRHAVIPIPFNEPVLATPTNPIHGEQYSYGFEVLNQNANPPGDPYDYAPIANEPWNTEDGGNTDFRAPYVGYSPNAALFKTVGNSAYDALETHLEKRLSHNLLGGVSYTYSHTYDEQSDIGLFFTGDNPNNLRTSYAHADFDRTNVLSGDFDVTAPNVAAQNSKLALLTNDWHLSGMGIAQSGQPYSLYEFYGAVGSIFFGDFPTLMNPVLPIKNGANPKSALTGNSGKFRSAGNFVPSIDPTQIDIHYLQPGTDGIPVSTGSDPQDIYETDFAPGQRNLFRQDFQKQLNLQIRKDFHPTERFTIRYDLSAFNVTNTTSLDIPQNQTQIRQNYGCSTSAFEAFGGDNNCALAFVNYGQIATSSSSVDQQSAVTNLDQLPYHNGSGKTTTIPTTLPVGVGSCSFGTIANGSACPNNGANFGSVTGTIGSQRMFTMSLHVLF